ncbi:MAG TPA: helix-turn-helix domain-containing protein [Actinomycetota bacterium]|jgi:excisionase family DNA binding protein|nr:helix-turn-helix domain-containing protein [Actinomycetota bacterium]
MADRLLSVEEVAERLGVPVSTLHYWSHRGEELVGARIGRRLRYRESQVDAYIAAKFKQREATARAR